MATQTATGGGPILTDRERWGGEVVASTVYRYRWGTHTFPARFQLFDDGEAHIQVNAPSDPPPSAEEIVADGLDGDHAEAAVAAILADGWGIDVDGGGR